MLFPDPMKDRYCKFVYNPEARAYERLWLRYADNTFEPVRRVGDLDRKWRGGPVRVWWVEARPADWLPWEHDFGFAWNHGLGETGRPPEWGDKSEAERRAGNAPYFMELDRDDLGRVVRRTERIDGRRETWRFRYDRNGRPTSCFSADGWGLDWEYDERGRRSADYAVGRAPFMRVFKYDRRGRLRSVDGAAYEYDARGFRATRRSPEGETRYHHLPDGRLVMVELADGRLVEYRHDERDRLEMRLVDGDPAVIYRWRDDGRLAGFNDGRREWTFRYGPSRPLPEAVTEDGLTFGLAYDQAGTLKCVTDASGRVVKAVQSDPFGVRLWDSNPRLRLPLGFAGGVEDPESGLVRFGALSYDPDTAAWTAPAAGDAAAWNDPVNRAPLPGATPPVADVRTDVRTDVRAA